MSEEDKNFMLLVRYWMSSAQFLCWGAARPTVPRCRCTWQPGLARHRHDEEPGACKRIPQQSEVRDKPGSETMHELKARAEGDGTGDRTRDKVSACT